MPERCMECPDGSIGCGPTGIDPCSLSGAHDEDKCHKVVVLVKEVGGKFTARLWVPGHGCAMPSGYTRAGDFLIRVKAGKVQNQCAVKVLGVEWPNPKDCHEVVDDEGKTT